jgi:hypothetical protein
MNLLDLRGLFAPRDAATSAQLVRAINQVRRNSSLYLRIWRADRGFQLQSEALPSPPASLRNLLSGPSSSGGVGNTWSAVLAEMELDGFATLVSGSETVRVTVTP